MGGFGDGIGVRGKQRVFGGLSLSALVKKSIDTHFAQAVISLTVTPESFLSAYGLLVCYHSSLSFCSPHRPGVSSSEKEACIPRFRYAKSNSLARLCLDVATSILEVITW